MRVSGELVFAVSKRLGWRGSDRAQQIGPEDVLIGGILVANICTVLAVSMFQK